MDNQEILTYKPLLFSVAYKLLGSVGEAEDIVQDTLIRWHEMDTSHVTNPRFYLTKAVSNRSINRLKELKKERELAYTGTWLPEPVITPDSDEETDELSLAFLFLLEKLSPIERGVFVLRESFGMSFQQIAETFGISQENCRQILSRARKSLGNGRPRFVADRQKHKEILEQFVRACVEEKPEMLAEILREDVRLYTDGGGKVSAAIRPLTGRDTVMKFVLGLARKSRGDYSVRAAQLNGEPGILLYDSRGHLETIMCFSFAGRTIESMYFVRNPEKLSGIR